MDDFPEANQMGHEISQDGMGMAQCSRQVKYG